MTFHIRLFWCVLCAFTFFIANHSIAQDRSGDEEFYFNIPRLSADKALTRFARQADLTLLFPYEEVKKVKTRPLHGRFTIRDGLQQMLRNTGIEISVGVGNEKEPDDLLEDYDGQSKPLEEQNMKSLSKKLMPGVITLAVASGGLGEVQAQEQSASGLGSMLEEVVVTARKREESLQDAPISITALSGDSLELRGITKISEIGSITPNLTYQNSPGAGGSSSVATVYVRGIGQRDFLATIENGVGFYIDDVYIARNVGAVVDLVDVDRVEVLRGPQGTLFGRNNIGGAIALHSKRPAEEFGGYVSATVGTDSRYALKAAVDAPISDTVLTKFSALITEQDGYVDRPAGGDLGDDNNKAVRGALTWLASDNVTVDVSLDYAKEDENGAAFTLLRSGAGLGGFADAHNNAPPRAGATCSYPGGLTSTNPLCYNDQWVSDSQNLGTAPTFSDTEVTGGRIGVEWDINENLTFKSITAYRDLDSTFARDADASPLTIVHFLDTFESEQLSQEFQLGGTAFDGALDWVTGVYYFDEEARNVNTLDFAIAQFPSANDLTTESAAAFAQGTWHVTDQLDITLGVRYTDEEKTFDPVQTAGPNIIGVPIGALIVPLGLNTAEVDETTPSVNVAYNVTDDFLAYATYSEGFRSGGFVQRIFPPLPFVPEFGPEFVESYELGFKYDTDNFSLNGSVFKADYTDIQVRTQNPGFIGFFEANVGDAEISGLELELKWQPVESWFIEASYGYTDAEYTAIRVDAPLIAEVNLDSEFDHVPENTASISVSKEFGLQDGSYIIARLSGSYSDEYFNNPANDVEIITPSVDLWDFNLLWNSADDRYSVNLGVKNLTDEEYLTAGYSNTAIGTIDVIRDRGIQWSLTGRYNF